LPNTKRKVKCRELQKKIQIIRKATYFKKSSNLNKSRKCMSR